MASVLVAVTTQLESTVKAAFLVTTDLQRCVGYTQMFPVVVLFQLKIVFFAVQVGADEEDPCIPCSCDPHGSISQTCVADESQASPGMKTTFSSFCSDICPFCSEKHISLF